VLVKWWLLAIPHYLIVGLFTGGLLSWTFDVGRDNGWQIAAGGGLIGILVLVSMVVLLFTARYPQGLSRSMIVTLAWPPPSHMVCRP
jgi:hypothetical protein